MNFSEKHHWGKDVLPDGSLAGKVQHVWIHNSYEAPGEVDPETYMRADIVHDDENQIQSCENCGRDELRDYIVTYVQGGPPEPRDGDVWVYECFTCFMAYFASILSEIDYAAMRKGQQ